MTVTRNNVIHLCCWDLFNSAADEGAADGAAAAAADCNRIFCAQCFSFAVLFVSVCCCPVGRRTRHSPPFCSVFVLTFFFSPSTFPNEGNFVYCVYFRFRKKWAIY